MKKVLITGADSYIGTSFENWLKQWPENYFVDTLDMRDEIWREKDFSEFDIVFHTAGIVHIKENKGNTPLFYRVNRDLAYETAAKAKNEGVKQFIFISTMSVYGIESGVINEDTVPSPKSSYGKSKLQAEELIFKLCDSSFKTAVLRPPMIYGEGCKGNYTKLEKLALKLPVFPDIKNMRSMIYIYNFCEFTRLLIEQRGSGLFFPQNDEYVCTSEMVRLIAQSFGKKIILTKVFNPVLGLFKAGVFNKMFGNLIYERGLSQSADKYCRYGFNESIAVNERYKPECLIKAAQEPLISIVMPAYNAERYITDAINSVIGQTYQAFELIVIDDGSKDNTANIAEELSSAERRIRFYKNPGNLGVSETRNRGVSYALGEWIAFLDSDDVWDASKLEKQILLANKKDCEFIFTGSAFINENGDYCKGTFEVPDMVDYKHLRTHNVISCSSVLIKKSLIEGVRMERDELHEDYAAWLKILKAGKRAYGINEPLLIYRISSKSKSGNKLKSVKMTYKVFRFIGCGKIDSAYFMCRHIAGSVLKYSKIRKYKKRHSEMRYEA